MNSVLVRFNDKNYYISYDDLLNKANNSVKIYSDQKLNNIIGNFDKSKIEKYVKNSIKMPSLMPSALKTENNQEKKMSSEQKIRKYIREQIIEMLSEQDGEAPSADELEAKRKSAEDKARKQAYARFFSQALAKFGYSSVSSIPDEKKKSFFDFIDSGWNSKQEQPKKKVDETLDNNDIIVKSKNNDQFYLNIHLDSQGKVDNIENPYDINLPSWHGLKLTAEMVLDYFKNRPDFYIENDLKETSSTGGVAGYETPNAFTGKPGEVSKKQKHIAQQLGYELVDKSYTTKDGITESMDAFYFKDENLTSEQKLGLAMRQVRNNLQEVEKIVQRTIKMKNEDNIDSSKVGKRTYSALKKINEKVIRLMVALNDLK